MDAGLEKRKHAISGFRVSPTLLQPVDKSVKTMDAPVSI
jgi:hypothetical protein